MFRASTLPVAEAVTLKASASPAPSLSTVVAMVESPARTAAEAVAVAPQEQHRSATRAMTSALGRTAGRKVGTRASSSRSETIRTNGAREPRLAAPALAFGVVLRPAAAQPARRPARGLGYQPATDRTSRGGGRAGAGSRRACC